MTLSASELAALIDRELTDFEATRPPSKLEGGNLNYTWRLYGKTKNLIAKIAPPYIASNPEVPLSPKRIEFEARALKLFQKNGLLQSATSYNVHPPEMLFFDSDNNLLVMEDFGALPHLTVVRNSKSEAARAGVQLGKFIGQIHRHTFKNPEISHDFNNREIQKTRFEIQYKPAAEYAKKAGVKDLSAIESLTTSLGKKLLNPGSCLIMGDLWPRSILADEKKLYIIDWEFTQWGRPLQDIGHFAAHCWMQSHTETSDSRVQSHRILWDNFWESYQSTLDSLFSELFDESELSDTATHIGAEILVRASGPFKNSYVYKTFDSTHPAIKQAGLKARNLILNDDFASLWL